MKAYKVCKAMGLRSKPVDSVYIEISGDVPDFDNLKSYDDFYRKEADLIFDVLHTSLPGGTLDKLIVRLLENKASLFKVTLN